MNSPFPFIPSFDASYLMHEKRLPFHLSRSAVDTWTEKHGLTHGVHIELDSPESKQLSIQLLNRDGYASASVSIIGEEIHHQYGPNEPSFKRGMETLLREELKKRR